MVGILPDSCSPKENRGLISEFGGCLEGPTRGALTSYGVAESELLTEDTVLKRMQGAMSYEFRTGLHISKEVNGKP
jgi:hypothetical protein